MKPWPRSPERRATAAPATLLPALLLIALANSSCSVSKLPSQPRVPPLPAEARQPTEIPSVCSQGCSNGLTQLRERSLLSPTGPTGPAWPASAPTIR